MSIDFDGMEDRKKMDIQTEEDCESGNDWEKKRLTK